MNNKSLLSAFLIVILICSLILVSTIRLGTAQSSDGSSFNISGYIVDSNGNGIAGAMIIFNVPQIVPAVYSDSSGYYVISAPAGTYHVNVWPPFDSNFIYYNQPEFVVNSNISKNITLASGYKVSGYITYSSGEPIIKAVVALNDYFCGWYSKYSGYYFVTAPAGTYTLIARPAKGPEDVSNFSTYYEHNVVVNGDLAKNITVGDPPPTPTPSLPPPSSPTTSKTFYDNFDDGVADGWTQQMGSWRVINEEYFVSVGVVENGISTVNGLNLKDYTIETKLRFSDDVGYRAGLVFRYMGKDTYYSLEVSNEYDVLSFVKYLPECAGYGTQDHGFVGRAPTEINFASGELMLGRKPIGNVPVAKINKDVEYTLRVTVTGNTYFGMLIGGGITQTITWEDKEDNPFTYGTVGLRARRADVSFDNFKIENATVSPMPPPTLPPPAPPSPDQLLPSYSDDFSADSGAWQYLGSAYRDQTNQYLVLTTSSNDQTGVAFFKTPVPDSFTASFSYKGSGDGFLFFFYKQKYPSTINWEESYGDNGVAGGRLGFNTQSIIPGYGIEFDGWANIAYEFADIVGGKPNPTADPSDNHIALIKDFTGNHLAYVNDERIYDNAWHQVFIEVQESSVAVYFDQALILQWSGVLDRTYDGLGFSGSNGQVEASWHLIDNFSITTRNLKKPLLTLSCKSSTSYSGFNVEIQGNLASDGTAISNAPILLSYSVTGGKSWEDLTLIYTGADGSYSATWLPSVTGNYLLKASYEGDAANLGVSSEIVNFAVMQLAETHLWSVSSNSTVTSLAFNSTTSELSFTVSGESGTTGYVKVAIAKSLVSNAENIKVYLDGNQLSYEVTSNADSWLLTFTYTHSTHQVTINLATTAMAFLGTEFWGGIGAAIIIAVMGLLLYFKKRNR